MGCVHVYTVHVCAASSKIIHNHRSPSHNVESVCCCQDKSKGVYEVNRNDFAEPVRCCCQFCR